jgi:hypothetical protein
MAEIRASIVLSRLEQGLQEKENARFGKRSRDKAKIKIFMIRTPKSSG